MAHPRDMTPREQAKVFQEQFPKKSFGIVEVERACRWTDQEFIDLGWQIQLPHSCDEWVIGNADDARSLIKEIEDAIQFVSSSA